VLLRLCAFGLAKVVTVVTCPLPAVLSDVLALPARGVGVAGVHVRGCPAGPAAQVPRLEPGEYQESVDPEEDYRRDDDVLPPHCASPLAEDLLAVLPGAAVLMHAWMGFRPSDKVTDVNTARTDDAAPDAEGDVVLAAQPGQGMQDPRIGCA